MLNPANPMMTSATIHQAIFPCFFIRVKFISASATIHPIRAALESVSRMAAIRKMMTTIFRRIILSFARFVMFLILSLQSVIMSGRNEMRK
jgi:hypothetical protein